MRAWSHLPGASLAWRIDSQTTWLSRARLKALEAHIHRAHRTRVPGHVVECGVARGGSAVLLGLCLKRYPQRRLFLCDTFAGLPAPTEADPDYNTAKQWTGGCAGTVPDVHNRLKAAGVDMSRVTLVEGLFQNTLPASGMDQIAVAHLDGDWYESTIVCLERLWPLMSPGGCIQLDDFGTWKGCRKATEEFMATRPGLMLRPIDGEGVWFEKPR
jgi:O-methyltransferase